MIGRATGQGHTIQSYRTISPKELEKQLGADVGYVDYFKMDTPKGYEFIDERATLDNLADGDFCITGQGLGAMKLRIKHGDNIRLYTKKGHRDFVFIDDSD